MQAANATKAPCPSLFEREPPVLGPEVVVGVEPTCATPLPTEPPQAEAKRPRPTAPASASAGRAPRFHRDRNRVEGRKFGHELQLLGAPFALTPSVLPRSAGVPARESASRPIPRPATRPPRPPLSPCAPPASRPT